ncbi:MAG: hypothetical protein HZC38_21455 [Chloroflexi bacterium]|nr:hypothetical protein [Chloroflexota bacterium]MBI5053208.1 hypothetical protein [Chloroflexota bacterium]MBI5081604.1 hypothetical protein [Chloroflexota bacterium]MBI5715972.1 hypothetical protein [Chloroflexota bacterium]
MLQARYLTDDQGVRVAVVLDIAEYRRVQKRLAKLERLAKRVATLRNGAERSRIGALYAAVASEDVALAEMGLSDYAAQVDDHLLPATKIP